MVLFFLLLRYFINSLFKNNGFIGKQPKPSVVFWHCVCLLLLFGSIPLGYIYVTSTIEAYTGGIGINQVLIGVSTIDIIFLICSLPLFVISLFDWLRQLDEKSTKE